MTIDMIYNTSIVIIKLYVHQCITCFIATTSHDPQLTSHYNDTNYSFYIC